MSQSRTCADSMFCRELGIGIIAYSPLGRGFFSDKPSAIGPGDFRAITPRFNSENLEKNRQLLENVKKIAERKGATTSQLALAWVLSRGDDVVPIPGTTVRPRVRATVLLSPAELHFWLRTTECVSPWRTRRKGRHANSLTPFRVSDGTSIRSCTACVCTRAHVSCDHFRSLKLFTLPNECALL